MRSNNQPRDVCTRSRAIRPTSLTSSRFPSTTQRASLIPSDDAPDFSGPLMEDSATERRLLERVVEHAQAAIPQQAKLAALRRLLTRLEKLGERAIVFTEYRDTLLHVRDAIGQRAVVVVIHGGMTADERRVALEAFVTGSARLLLATDAAGEGLNLHRTCRVVVNLELPWNPMRLEQRIGRVDRIGQTRCVHVFHLIAQDTGEEWILERLKGRLAQAGRELGAADPLGLFDAREDRPPDVGGIRLLAEATAEHDRLRTIRSITAPTTPDRAAPAAWPAGPGDLGDSDTLTAHSRRRRLRERLSSRALAIVRTSIDDETGRSVAVHLAPLVITHSALGTLGTLTCADLESIDPTFLQWHAVSRCIHRRFWARRAARERAIARALEEDRHSPVQAGLFDRRAEHHRLIDATGRRAIQNEARSRIAAAERATAIHLEPPRPVLLLVV